MRKLMIALAFVGLSTGAVMAQDTEVPSQKYSVATNSFWSNWFWSFGVNANAWYSSQEHKVDKLPFSDKRGSLGLEVAVGKWFTPGLGLRTKVEGGWGRQVNTNSSHLLFTQIDIHEDVMFNFSNLFYGYNENRVWNFIPYFGIGYAHNFTDKVNEISYHFGLLNNFKVSKRLQIFADLNVAAYEGEHDAAHNDNYFSHKKFTSRRWDKKIGLSLGLTYNVGKCNWEKVPDVDALMAMNKEQVDALNQTIKEQQDENARLRDMLANQKPAQPSVVEASTKTLFVGTAASVFFNINSAKVASRKDLVNVKELAEYAKANNSKIVVSGYADSKTGSAAYNQALSQRRADTVAKELVKMGVNPDNIITEAKGGVDNLSPFSYNRRATVKIQ